MKKFLSFILAFSIIFSSIGSASALELEFPSNTINLNDSKQESEDSIINKTPVNDSNFVEEVDFDTFAGELSDLINDYENTQEYSISGSAAIQYSNGDNSIDPTSDFEVTNRLIVKSEYAIDTLNSIGYVNGYDDLHILQFASYTDFCDAYEYYSDLDYIEYVQEDGIITESELNEELFTEASLKYPTQYQSDYFGYSDAKEHMASGEVDIAVIDSGVANDHEMLVGRVEPTGFDSINNESCYDYRGHGTHVAGIIVANTKSNVTIRPYKVLDNAGQGTDTQVYLGIQAAIEDEVDIINLSLSKKGDSEILREVITEAYNQGITIVAAAGNNNENVTDTVYTPASFPEVICAVAIDTTRYKSDTSNWGSTKDLSAPGVNILSAHLNNTYKVMSGTSMAAPFIASAASYLLAENSSLTPDDVYTQLYNSTVRGGGTHNIRYVCPGELIRSTTVCSTPVFVPEVGEFAGYLNVSITCSQSNAEILYHTSDMDSTKWLSYTKPIRIDDTTTLTAYAICAGYKNSSEITVTYPKSSIDATQFEVDENGVLTGYTGIANDVAVPQYCNGSVVTSIAATAFSGNENITSVTLSKYVTNIDDSAFSGCTSLLSLTAPSVTTLFESTFEGCSNLRSIDMSALAEIPAEMFMNCENLTTLSLSALKTIGDKAFYGCTALSHITAPLLSYIGASAFENSSISAVNASNVTYIGEKAFSGSGIKSVAFNYATTVGDYAFYDCKALTAVNFNYLTALGVNVFENCTALKSVQLNSLKSVPSYTFRNCNSLTSVTLSAATEIGEFAFTNAGFTKLTLPKVTTIAENAIYDCKSLTTVTMAALKIFDPDYFSGCSSIESFTFAALTAYNVVAYQISEYFPNLQSFVATKFNGTIPAYAFAGCSKLNTFKFNNVTKINEYAFQGTALTTVECHGVETLGSGAFNDITTLLTVSMAKLTNFGPYYFKGSTNIQKMVFAAASIPSGYKLVEYFPNLETFSVNSASTIPAYLFKDHQKIKIVSASSLLSIGAEAFMNSTITEPSFQNCTKVGNKAFADCHNLNKVNLRNMLSIDTGIFEGSEEYIYELNLNGVKNISAEDYATFNFSKFKNLESIYLSSLTLVPKEAFKNCTALKAVTMGNVTTIYENAFENCISLTDVSLPLVTEIKSGAFRNCTSLNSFTADSITAFDPTIIKGCSNIETISLNAVMFLPYDDNGALAIEGVDNLVSISADSITAIPSNFLKGSSNLTTASFKNAKVVGSYAFYDTPLTNFTCSDILVSIGDYAFGKTDITEANFESVEYIGNYSFADCEELSTVYLPLVEETGEYAFNNCSSLTSVEFSSLEDPDNLPFNVFDGCTSLRNVILTSITELPVDSNRKNHISDIDSLSYFCANAVTEIPDEYFIDKVNLSSVEFMSVLDIGNKAFMNTTSLQNFDGCGILRIGEYAFYASGIYNVVFDSVNTVGDYAFANCPDLVGCEFKTDVKLGEGTFENSQMLDTVVLPGKHDIPAKCFKNCTSLMDIKQYSSNSATSAIFKSIGEEAFYGCQALGISEINLTYVETMGKDCLKGTFIEEFNETAETDYVLPKLKTIEEGAFNGIKLKSLALENVEVIKALPECEYVVIGSDIVDFQVSDALCDIYAPENTIVKDYCLENNLRYIPLNETYSYRTNVAYECTNPEEEIIFDAVGFDLTYTWYGCNEDDRTDSVFLSSESNTFIPATAILNDGDEYKYRYYYCVATSIENGNVLEISSNLCANALVKVIGTDDTLVDYSEGFIYTNSVSNVNTTDNIFTDIGENVEIIPTYTADETKSYGTGSVVKVFTPDGTKVLKEYIIIVYGDVNGDGVVDAIDAQAINICANNKGELSYDYYSKAADIDGSYDIDVSDYQAVVNKIVA